MCSPSAPKAPQSTGAKQPRILLPRSYLENNNLSIGRLGGRVGGRGSGAGNAGSSAPYNSPATSGLQIGSIDLPKIPVMPVPG